MTITFLLLGIAELGTGNAAHIQVRALHRFPRLTTQLMRVPFQTAGGAFGLCTAFLAWYVAAANLLTPDTSFFVLPIGDVSKKD